MQKVKKFLATTALTIATLGLAACDVEQTEEGAMPEVEGGNLPEYDVDVPEVVVGTEERTIDVPVVGVEPADAGAPGED